MGVVNPDDKTLIDVARNLVELLSGAEAHLDSIEPWYQGKQPAPKILEPTDEATKLLELSRTPWLGLIVSTVAQALYVDGFRSVDGQIPEMWDTWVHNGMPKHHVAIHRAALGYGWSFASSMPGVSPFDGAPRSVLRGWSPRRCYAHYVDPAFDEWPEYVLTALGRQADGTHLYRLYDDTFEYSFQVKDSKWSLRSDPVPHLAGHPPFVRYTNQMDLDGNIVGEVEPFIGIASRIDKTTFDRMLTQHHNSWKKIWASGLTRPANMNDSQAQAAKLKMRQDTMLMLEDPNSRVGTLPETSTEALIAAVEHDIDDIAVQSQLNHLLTGKLSNLSEDTLVQANRPLAQKIFERKVSFGDSHSRLLRLAALQQGDTDVANDIHAHVTWQDTEVRSLSQAADALGKLGTMLGIPLRALWRMVPDITETDAQEWERLLESESPEDRFLGSLAPKPAPLSAVDEGSGDE